MNVTILLKTHAARAWAPPRNEKCEHKLFERHDAYTKQSAADITVCGNGAAGSRPTRWLQKRKQLKWQQYSREFIKRKKNKNCFPRKTSTLIYFETLARTERNVSLQFEIKSSPNDDKCNNSEIIKMIRFIRSIQQLKRKLCVLHQPELTDKCGEIRSSIYLYAICPTAERSPTRTARTYIL